MNFKCKRMGEQLHLDKIPEYIWGKNKYPVPSNRSYCYHCKNLNTNFNLNSGTIQ